MADRVIKYNPAFLTDEELINSFVVRRADLEIIMRIISNNDTGANQHVLVIGPRGSGKTTLVRRVAIEIERDNELSSRWYPLIFSEESYEVVTAGEFWLEALFHLSEQVSDDKWKRTYFELKKEIDDQRLTERALAQLCDFADSQGKRIILIVENLNMLLDSSLSDNDAWKLRHTLINEKRLMLLATATNRFENIENSSHAMFEMFKIHELKPLDEDECNRVWEWIAGKKLTRTQIRPIRILTGGNLRLLIIIARFSGHRSFGKLLDDIISLIDDHTEYFKSHLDNLPVTERKVYLALAELWDPSTAREIAAAARLDVNKTSSLLNRLVGRGAVDVEGQTKTTKWYMVAERMYNIYYLMRRRGKPSDRVQAAVKFMISMYDPESATKMIIEEAVGLSPERCSDYYLAYSEIIRTGPDNDLRERIINSAPKNFLESPYVSKILESSLKSDGVMESENRLDKDKALEMFLKGTNLGLENHYEDAIQAYDELIAKYKDRSELQIAELVAVAMFNKGICFGTLNRSEDEILAYDELITKYKDRSESQIAEHVAKAMVNKGFSLGDMNRSEGAIQVYDELIAEYKDCPEPQIAELVADAMFNKGICFGAMDHSEEAIRVYDELIAKYRDYPDLPIAEQVAKAMKNKGIILAGVEKYDEAEKEYRKAIELLPDFPGSYGALVKLLLKQAKREKEAMQIAEDAVQKFPDQANLLNTFAWAACEYSDMSILDKAEAWIRKAAALSPEDLSIQHTLSCVLSALGKGDEALESAKKYIGNAEFVQQTMEDAIRLFVELAAAGYAKEALESLKDSPSAKHLEPLVIGLKLFIGEELKVALEIREVANDVVKRIEELKQKRMQGRIPDHDLK